MVLIIGSILVAIVPALIFLDRSYSGYTRDVKKAEIDLTAFAVNIENKLKKISAEEGRLLREIEELETETERLKHPNGARQEA